MSRVAVVGCGPAGAATAHVLAAADADCVVFERATSPGGRAASRTRETPVGSVTYDYGANYLKDDDERVNELFADVAEPTDTPGNIYTFDADGVVSPGRESDESKWSTPAGVADLVARLVESSDATLRTETPITELVHESSDAWHVETPAGRAGPFDAVVLTPPAPVTADLLAAADWDTDARARLVDTVRAVEYATVWSVVAGYEQQLDRPYYGLVDTSGEHRVGWISRESCKPGHVPAGETLVMQGGHDWSRRHADSDPATVTAAMTEATAEVIGESFIAEPAWTDATLWDHALPEGGVDPGPLREARQQGCYVAGDWVAGEARMHAAVRSGLDTGERIVYAL